MGYILTRLFLAKAFYVADSSTASDFRRFKDEVKAETQKTSETVKAAQDTIKAVAYRVTKEIMEDPLTADRRSDPATKQIMQAASQKILQEPEENRSIDDWLIAAYEALQNGEYREAIKRAEKALAANPPPESLWRIHNLLGLSYHYLQPDNWEKGQPEEWFQKSREYYQLAIKEANSEGERLLSRANLAFLYLDTGRYEECENEVNSILATANEIEHGSAVYDLVRLVAAALKAVQGQPEQSAKYLNEVKDLPRWKYLFEGKDISTDIVKKLVKIEGIKPEYRDFLNQYLKD